MSPRFIFYSVPFSFFPSFCLFWCKSVNEFLRMFLWFSVITACHTQWIKDPSGTPPPLTSRHLWMVISDNDEPKTEADIFFIFFASCSTAKTFIIQSFIIQAICDADFLATRAFEFSLNIDLKPFLEWKCLVWERELYHNGFFSITNWWLLNISTEAFMIACVSYDHFFFNVKLFILCDAQRINWTYIFLVAFYLKYEDSSKYRAKFHGTRRSLIMCHEPDSPSFKSQLSLRFCWEKKRNST